MGGEPWCYHPEQIATLTDFQVLDFYIRRQAERIERFKAESKGEPMPLPDDLPPPDPNRKGATWEYLVSTGMSPDEADRATANQR